MLYIKANHLTLHLQILAYDTAPYATSIDRCPLQTYISECYISKPTIRSLPTLPITHPKDPLKTIIQFTPHTDKFLFNPGADPAGFTMLKRKGFMFKDAYHADGAVWAYLPNIELFDKESQDRYLASHTDILTRPTKTRKDFE